jgi:hypothetical protein
VGELDTRVTANAAAIETKAPQSALNSTDQALAALTVEVAGKQAQLGVGTVTGGHSMLENGSIRAIKGAAPVQVTATPTHVEVTMDESYFGAITAITDATAAKQDQLTAGTGMVYHEKLLEGTKIKSLTPGANVTLTSTGEFVSISAEGGTSSATGPAGALSLVNTQGKILRILPGTGVVATSASSAGYVELGMETQNVQFRAPFSVRDQSSGTALRALLGDTKAELYTALEVNGTARVTGALTANATIKVGVYPPAGETVAVDGTVGATGNISTAAQVTAQTMLCNGELRVGGKMRCDVLEGEAGTQVTCNDDFSVDGAVTVSGNVASAGQVAAQTMFCQGSLTLNGNLVGWSPFFCAGRVNGENMTILSSRGRVGFTFTRPSGYPTGVYKITFATAAPDADYVISAVQEKTGNIKVWDSSTFRPTVNSFHIVAYAQSWSLMDTWFSFSVYV